MLPARGEPIDGEVLDPQCCEELHGAHAVQALLVPCRVIEAALMNLMVDEQDREVENMARIVPDCAGYCLFGGWGDEV